MLIWIDSDTTSYEVFASLRSEHLCSSQLPADWNATTATTTLKCLGVSVSDSIRRLPISVACNPRRRAPRGITAPRCRPFFYASKADMRNAP